MKKIRKGVYCCICGQEIYGNVDPTREVECGFCVQVKVEQYRKRLREAQEASKHAK